MTERISIGFERDDRLDRARRIGWLDLKRLARSSALVVGAGALGNELVKNLALSGIGKLTIIDFDRIERSNLSRCLFFRDGDTKAGLGKAERLAEAVKTIAPNTTITPIAEKVEDLPAEEFGDHEVIFGCLDNYNARLHVNSHARKAGVPYIDGGMHGTIGRIFISNPPGPCLECASNATHSRIADLRFSCTERDVHLFTPPVPAEITTTSIVSALAVREALRLLSDRAPPIDGQMIYYDGERGRLELLEVDVDPRCPNHQKGGM